MIYILQWSDYGHCMIIDSTTYTQTLIEPDQDNRCNFLKCLNVAYNIYAENTYNLEHEHWLHMVLDSINKVTANIDGNYLCSEEDMALVKDMLDNGMRIPMLIHQLEYISQVKTAFTPKLSFNRLHNMRNARNVLDHA